MLVREILAVAVVRNSADNGWLLIGATSWGYGCADGNYPGVWAKVSHFLTWISSYTGDSGNDNNDVSTGCGDDEFTCNNGECISASYYNDGASGVAMLLGLLIVQMDLMNLVYGKMMIIQVMMNH